MFRTDEVLAAFAAGSGEISGLEFAPARPVGESGRVLIVGMRSNHQNAAKNGEAIESERDLRSAGEVALREGRGKKRGEDEDGRQGDAHLNYESRKTCFRVPVSAWIFILQHKDRVDQLFGARRAAGDEDIDGGRPDSQELARSY